MNLLKSSEILLLEKLMKKIQNDIILSKFITPELFIVYKNESKLL